MVSTSTLVASGRGDDLARRRQAGVTTTFLLFGTAPLPSRWFVLALVVTVALSRMRQATVGGAAVRETAGTPAT